MLLLLLLLLLLLYCGIVVLMGRVEDHFGTDLWLFVVCVDNSSCLDYKHFHKIMVNAGRRKKFGGGRNRKHKGMSKKERRLARAEREAANAKKASATNKK